MSVFGIISEFNPLHLGHQYLIQQARQSGAQTVVCIMSGTTVQRGELAVADPYLRAEAAILAGADLVLSLPFPWCSASAEGFAAGGIAIARHFCDTVFFGSECGDVELLTRAATVSASQDFRDAFSARLENGEQAASAYHALLKEYGIEDLSSNDVLGVAYIRAALEQNAALRFQTVKRVGSAYSEQNVLDGQYPSALAIRQMWHDGKFEESLAYLPHECAELYRRARDEGRLTDPDALDSIWLSFFRLHEPEALAECLGAEGGLARRICAAARESTTAQELLERIRTKRYTDAHLRRTMLFCLADVHPEDVKILPAYTTLLAANERGRDLLKQGRREDRIPVVTKPSDSPKDTTQFMATQRVDSIFTLATEKRTPADGLLTKSPYIL